MKRYYPKEPTAAQLDELRRITDRYDVIGLFIGPHHFYAFTDLPSELKKPADNDPIGKSSLSVSRTNEEKSPAGRANVEANSEHKGAEDEGGCPRAENRDALKVGAPVRNNRVGKSDNTLDDNDSAAIAEINGKAESDKKTTPAGQAGGLLESIAECVNESDSDADTQSDSQANGTVCDDSAAALSDARMHLSDYSYEVPLFSEIEFKALDDEMRPKIGGKDVDDKLGKRLMALAPRGNKRRLMALPADWSDRLDRLAERFLNFKAVIDYVRTECQVASISTTRAAKLAPILLLGSPGIGKTAFAMDLAEILSGTFHMVAMENSQSGSSIGGSAKFWSNTRTGMVFDALVDKDVINPIFLVDELDKAATDSAYDPMAPLYQLLEPRTAAMFRDESIPELAIDTSHINWILTANDIDRVPSPIRSRLHVVEVPLPTPAQTRIIVNHIFAETLAQLKMTVVEPDYVAVIDQMTMSNIVVDALCSDGIRVVKRSIRNATVKALGRRSSVVEYPDIYDLASFEIDPVYMLPQ